MFTSVHIVKKLKKYKKSLLIIGLLFGYIIFWWWFFNERGVAIQDDDVHHQKKQEVTEEIASPEPENNHEFKDFGTFWISFSLGDQEVKAPIVEGVTDEKLAEGVGHHKTTAFPNEERGNVVLSGHRWKFGKNPAYTVFADIDQLQAGDHVTVHYSGRDFVYKIFESETVQDNAIEILEQTDEPILTFYTCTPKYTAFRRLVFRARLIK